MASAVVFPSLLAGNPFTAGETQLCEAMASTDTLLVTAVYVLPPLRRWLAVFSPKSVFALSTLNPIERYGRGTNLSVFWFSFAAQWHFSGSKPGRNALVDTAQSCREEPPGLFHCGWEQR